MGLILGIGARGDLESERVRIADNVPSRLSEPAHANGRPKQDDRWLRSVLHNSSEIFTIVDPDGTLRYANPAFGRVLGYDPEDAVGTMNVLGHVHPEDLPHVQEATQRALSGKGVVTNRAEYRFRHKDGSWRWVESLGTYLLDDPHVKGVVVASRDVTERIEAEEQHRTLVERVPPVIYIQKPREGQAAVYDTTYMSPRVEEVLGYPPGRFLKDPRFWDEVIHPDDLERVRAEDQRTDRTGEPFRIEYRLIARDGRTVWVRDEATLVRGARGDAPYWLGAQSDITDRKEVEAALRESERRFRSSFENAAVGMALVGTDGRWLRVNRSLCGTVGYSEGELLEKSFQDITHPEDLGKDLGQARRLLGGEIGSYQLEKRYIRKDGSVVWILLNGSLVRDEEGGPLYFIAQVQDISGRKRAEDQLQRQAFHDALTGLPNRKLFMDRLRHALERTRRRRGQKVAVLFMDLDGFKVVNDSLGHEAGDLLLTVVAQRLGRILRPEDTLARFGGDEFVVLLDEVGGPEEAVLVAERIIEELGRPFVIEGQEIFVSVSVGIGIGDARTKTPEYLIRDADTAMYRAKEGRSGYRIFEPAMYERAKRRLELENELRRAIERGEFVVRYQPIVDLQADEVWGVEALVRWEHPERGLLDPSEFMAVVEEGGLIVPLGERVLEEACSQAKRWQEDPRIPPLMVSVNLSARQLRLPDLPRVIGDSLRKTGFDAQQLSLDITETAYIRALEGKTATFDRLKGLGVGISLDDFGVGYSSLSYLKRLPADTLKIDKSFVRGLGEDAEDTAIVRMIIDLAHTLGMKVVAEGVEGWAQRALLAEMGCDLAQGFHFARPLPPEGVSEFLTR